MIFFLNLLLHSDHFTFTHLGLDASLDFVFSEKECCAGRKQFTSVFAEITFWQKKYSHKREGSINCVFILSDMKLANERTTYLLLPMPETLCLTNKPNESLDADVYQILSCLLLALTLSQKPNRLTSSKHSESFKLSDVLSSFNNIKC